MFPCNDNLSFIFIFCDGIKKKNWVLSASAFLNDCFYHSDINISQKDKFSVRA